MAGKAYDVVIRTVSVTSDAAVSTVPSTNRLQSHPAGGAFKSFVDEDDLGHISVVVETNREVDGEVESVDLALAGEDLTLTVGRSIGADLTATVEIPEGLPLAGGTLTGNLEITPGDVAGPALTITKGDSGGGPVVRMVHPNNNTTTGQRPFNARRDGESDYFEVNGRLGGTNAQPGIAIGPGGAPRDVTLFRDSANVWRSPDAVHVGELRVDSAGRADSRTQLGLGTAATEDTGTASGDVALLGTGGAFAVARIPDLPASKITSGAFNNRPHSQLEREQDHDRDIQHRPSRAAARRSGLTFLSGNGWVEPRPDACCCEARRRDDWSTIQCMMLVSFTESRNY